MFAARAYTETPGARTTERILRRPARRPRDIHGQGGTPLLLSHSLYKTGYAFAEDKLGKAPGAGAARRPSCWKKCSRASWKAKTRRNLPSRKNWNFSRRASCRERFSRWPDPRTCRSGANCRGTSRSPRSRRPSPRQTADVAEPERRAFLIANLFANQLAFRFFNKFVASFPAAT